MRGLLGSYYVANTFDFSNVFLRRGLIKAARERWNIEDINDFELQLNWLLEQGNHAEYRSLHARLAALSETSRSQYLETHKEHINYSKLKIVAQGIHQLPSGDISAFELAWVIYLSRIGYVEDYLTMEKAWEYKIKAARRLHERYSSWAEYYLAYSLGNKFSLVQYSGLNRLFDTELQKLMRNSTVLFREAAWGQNLEPEAL